MQLSILVEKLNAYVSCCQAYHWIHCHWKNKFKQFELNRQQINVHLVTHLVPARDINSCSPRGPVASLYQWAFHAEKLAVWSLDQAEIIFTGIIKERRSVVRMRQVQDYFFSKSIEGCSVLWHTGVVWEFPTCGGMQHLSKTLSACLLNMIILTGVIPTGAGELSPTPRTGICR